MQSEISWTKSTFNPWIGCQEAGPGCAHCYAKTLVERWGNDFAERRRTAPANWAQVRRWNKLAPESEFAGVKGYWPVFCASLADIFDNQVPEQWRVDFWALVRECSNLTFLVVTKRIGNAKAMLPANWGDGYPNVVLIATVVNQPEVDRDVVKLLDTPAWRHGLSIEPILGPVDLTAEWFTARLGRYPFKSLPPEHRTRLIDLLDWVIAGGESGHQARPPHPDWFRSLRDQCAAAGVSYHFKQWGEWGMAIHADVIDRGEGIGGRLMASGTIAIARNTLEKLGKKKAGRELDGRTHDGIAIEQPQEIEA